MSTIAWLIEYREGGQTVGYVKDIEQDGDFRVILTRSAHEALKFSSQYNAQSILDDSAFVHAMGSDHPCVVAEHMFDCGISKDKP